MNERDLPPGLVPVAGVHREPRQAEDGAWVLAGGFIGGARLVCPAGEPVRFGLREPVGD